MLLQSRLAGLFLPISEQRQGMENIRDFFGVTMRKGFAPLLSVFERLGVTPNQVTVFGTLLNGAVAVLIVFEHLIWAGIVLLLAGCCDMLDGALARRTQKSTEWGAFLDSTLDRVSEGIVLAAITYLLAARGHFVDAGLVALALLGSVLVSYTRSRAEGLGVECKVGLLSRPERIILVALGLFFNVLSYTIYILLALTVFTVIQRMVHTYRAMHRQTERGGSVER